MSMLCTNCLNLIPEERLLALPNTQTCVNCSQEVAKVGITIWDKTTPHFFVVEPEVAQEYRRLEGHGCQFSGL